MRSWATRSVSLNGPAQGNSSATFAPRRAIALGAVLGVIFFTVGLPLQAGATGAVKTVKMSAKLVSGSQPHDAADDAGQQDPP